MAAWSSGTTAGPLSMMLRIWGMPGKPSLFWRAFAHLVLSRNYVTQDILRRIMTDYFGYDVHFVMNVTDIDDKVGSVLACFHSGNSLARKIIDRARQNHLLNKFRSETTSLSNDLIAQVHTAWRIHVRGKLAKGLPQGQTPNEGEEEAMWSRFTELILNKDWKQECLRRDEKFDMYFSSAVCIIFCN